MEGIDTGFLFPREKEPILLLQVHRNRSRAVGTSILSGAVCLYCELRNRGRSARTAIAKALPHVPATTLTTKPKNPNPGLVNTSVYYEAWSYDRKGVALTLLSRWSDFHSPRSSTRMGNYPWMPRQAGEAALKLTRWRRVLIVSDGLLGLKEVSGHWE